MKSKKFVLSIAFRAVLICLALSLALVWLNYILPAQKAKDSLWQERRERAKTLSNYWQDVFKHIQAKSEIDGKLNVFTQMDKFISKNANINKIFVIDLNGNYLYHSDPVQAGHAVDSLFWEKVKSIKNQTEFIGSDSKGIHTKWVNPYIEKGKITAFTGVVVNDNLLSDQIPYWYLRSWVISIVIMVLALLLLIWATHPVYQLTKVLKKAFNRFSTETRNDGRLLLSHRIHWESHSDLDYIAPLFNVMAEKISESYTRLGAVRGEGQIDKGGKDKETGLFNIHLFQEDLSRLLELSKNRQFPLVVIRFDLVHFNNLNSEAISASLGILSGCIEGNTRARSDRAYRIAEDRFAIVLTGIEKSKAEEKAVAIAQSYFSSRLDHETWLAFGIGQYNMSDSKTEFLKLIEIDLYQNREKS